MKMTFSRGEKIGASPLEGTISNGSGVNESPKAEPIGYLKVETQ